MRKDYGHDLDYEHDLNMLTMIMINWNHEKGDDNDLNNEKNIFVIAMQTSCPTITDDDDDLQIHGLDDYQPHIFNCGNWWSW